MLKFDDRVMACDEHIKEQVYYMICEATANAVKHGDARKIWIELELTKMNSRSLSATTGRCPPAEQPISPQGVGVEIMRTRAQMMGGSFSLECNAEWGVMVTCTIPCSRHVAKDGG